MSSHYIVSVDAGPRMVCGRCGASVARRKADAKWIHVAWRKSGNDWQATSKSSDHYAVPMTPASKAEQRAEMDADDAAYRAELAALPPSKRVPVSEEMRRFAASFEP